MNPFAGWANFYVITGSAAGALIGLQFVVATLVANGTRSAEEAQVGNTFATPTIIYLSAVLLLSGIVTAPWDGVGAVAVLLGLVGLGGIVYSITVVRRLRGQAIYKLQVEDTLFHVLFPIAAFVTLVVSAGLMLQYVREALFIAAAAALLLLFTGIHNAWDNVVYHIFVRTQNRSSQ